MRRAIVLVALAALAAGCADFETPSIVLDLRVLGMQATVDGTANDAEVVVDFDPLDPGATEFPDVTVTALVADPGAERRLAWTMTACSPTSSLRCDDPEALYIDMGSGVVEDPETPGAEPPRGTLAINILLLEEAVSLDALAGFGGVAIQVELCVRPEGTTCAEAGVYASKRVVYAPRQPPERTPNTNPRLETVCLDGSPFPTEGLCGDPAVEPLAATVGEEVVMRPVEPEGAREVYVLPTFDGGSRTIQENLRYSWFATAGSFTRETSGGPIDLFGNVPPLDTTWVAPDEPGLVQLWVVQRDERGGASWTRRCIQVF